MMAQTETEKETATGTGTPKMKPRPITHDAPLSFAVKKCRRNKEKYGKYEFVVWLRDYHTPSFNGLVSLNADACVEGNNLNISKDNYGLQGKISDGFRHAGTMVIALVLKVTDGNEWLIEGVISSVTNLLKKFHQSFFLFPLASPSKFVSVRVYTIAFALLVVPLPLATASLYVDANELDFGMKNDESTSIATASNEIDITFRSWKWPTAAKEVFVVLIWGVVILLLPYSICQMPERSPTTSFVSWILLSMLSLLILYPILGSPFSYAYASQKGQCAMLKSVTIPAIFIGLLLMCLNVLQELELRTCRSIVDGVLIRLAENCESLNSLLVYDGGSREGFLHFINNCRGLSTLRLRSCCLVTGEGLKALGIAMSSGLLKELALINCDVVERESGLLATLGQHLKQLSKLDLSHNESLLDKEFISMLVSCNNLVDLRLRGCKGLTSLAILSMFKSCKRLENVDIIHCCGIEAEAIEFFVLNSPRLRRMQVEESKVSDVARTWASHKLIEVVASFMN
ncbi:hypothetical protein GH714_009834 [Hevea brasiliensis]|uniref:Uncharacterized protein n=1 Tax=Hevea brasiliensis TaxID=3981 RepID=A0A6A6M871_HEVBR|nr:hypothetical protein GH714_009834 [Hevea brasiliensis]